MAAPARGLSPSDLGQIRETLAAGRRPRVVFTEAAGQVAGTVGQVVQLADPATTDEWIVVRFGRDELPFSPGDLAIPGRGGARKAAKPPAPAPPLRLVEPPRATRPARPVEPGAAKPDSAKPDSARPDAAKAKPASAEPDPAPVATVPEPRRAPAKPAKPKPPASLTVTLTYSDREWMVSAIQGSRTLAKPYVIRPTEALRMVALLDVPGVHDAVESIIAAERVEAEGRAQRLRAELAEIESRLAELTERA